MNMKKLITTIVALFVGVFCICQENTDVLYFTDGRTARVAIDEVLVSEIICYYPNETIKCHISKTELSKIVFRSGREEVIQHPQQQESSTAQTMAASIGALSAGAIASVPSSEAKEDSVFVTPSGSAYHKSRSCSYIAGSSSVKAISISEVGSKHPCSRCYGKAAPATTTTSSTTSSSSKSTTPSGRTIYTGPRGGKYYINSSGKKVYIK